MKTTRKYELTNETITMKGSRVLYRIKSLSYFGDVKVGQLGCYIECYSSLSQTGNCWIYDNAKVHGFSTRVVGDAKIKDNADVMSVFGMCIVNENAVVSKKRFSTWRCSVWKCYYYR